MERAPPGLAPARSLLVPLGRSTLPPPARPSPALRHVPLLRLPVLRAGVRKARHDLVDAHPQVRGYFLPTQAQERKERRQKHTREKG